MHTSQTQSEQVNKKLLGAYFVFLLFIPIVATLAFPERTGVGDELRPAAALPRIHATADIRTIPSQVDTYFKDHFGLRTDLIFLYNLVRTHYLGAPPRRAILFGYDNQMFLQRLNARIQQPVYTSKELHRRTELLIDRARAYKEQGIDYYVLIGPAASSIYPELLPEKAQHVRHNNLYNEFIEHWLRHGDGTTVIDVKAPLIEKKYTSLSSVLGTTTDSFTPLYYKYDHHWSDYGAYIAYQELMERLSAKHPCLKPLPLSSFTIEYREAKNALARIIGLDRILKERRIHLIPNPNQDEQLSCQNDRILFRADSMANAIIIILQMQGVEAYFINYDDDEAFRTALEIIDPNIVIDLRFEDVMESIFSRDAHVIK